MIVSMYPYLVLNGEGQETVAFYAHALDAKVMGVQTFGDMPEHPEFPLPAEAKDRVLNAHLKIGGLDLMLSDTMPGQPCQVGEQVTIAINITSAEQAEMVFKKLQEGGQVLMPLQPTFWSPAYGQIKDKFGITWQVSTSNE